MGWNTTRILGRISFKAKRASFFVFFFWIGTFGIDFRRQNNQNSVSVLEYAQHAFLWNSFGEKFCAACRDREKAPQLCRFGDLGQTILWAGVGLTPTKVFRFQDICPFAINAIFCLLSSSSKRNYSRRMLSKFCGFVSKCYLMKRNVSWPFCPCRNVKGTRKIKS